MQGVPTFFVDSGQTPAAALVVRAGFADESLVTHGWLHLLEHLAMHGRDDRRVNANASVGLWSTEFQVSGEAEDVVAHLNALCRWLAEPTFGDLEHERRILQAEAAQRGHGEMSIHLDFRYGAHGVGLPAYRELGLLTADEQGLRDLARRHYSAGNVALALNCPPPPGLELALPPGDAVPLPDALAILPSAPVRVAAPSRLLSVSGLLQESVLSPLVGDVVSQVVTHRLRHELGSSYSTTGDLERVDCSSVLLCLSSDILEDKGEEGLRVLARTLEQLDRDGIGDDELDAARTRALRALRDDPTGVWQAFNSASAVTRGAGPVRAAEVVERLESVTREDLEAEVRRFVGSALLSGPFDETVHVPGIRFWDGFEPAGPREEEHRFTPWKAPGDRSELTIGTRTVDLRNATVQHTRDLDRSAALLRYPDGARTLITRDGASLHVEPNVWHRGEEAVARLETVVPAHLHVDMEARSADDIPEPPGRRTRLLRPLRLVLAGPVGLALAYAFGVFLVVAGFAANNGLPILSGLVWLYVVRREHREQTSGGTDG